MTLNRLARMIAIASLSIATHANFAWAQATSSTSQSAAQTAPKKAASQQQKPKKNKSEKVKKSGGATFHEGSGESRAERDRRLTRECRGRSNAGLCEGYARP